MGKKKFSGLKTIAIMKIFFGICGFVLSTIGFTSSLISVTSELENVHRWRLKPSMTLGIAEIFLYIMFFALLYALSSFFLVLCRNWARRMIMALDGIFALLFLRFCILAHCCLN